MIGPAIEQTDDEVQDFADELSDEALDRVAGGTLPAITSSGSSGTHT
jgi:hypothetical protein